MRQAIELLPPELKPFFDQFKDEVVLRVTDPDLWRNVGWEDDPNHFLDFGVTEYGAYPFEALPREYGAALEKFGDTDAEAQRAAAVAGSRGIWQPAPRL